MSFDSWLAHPIQLVYFRFQLVVTLSNYSDTYILNIPAQVTGTLFKSTAQLFPLILSQQQNDENTHQKPVLKTESMQNKTQGLQ